MPLAPVASLERLSDDDCRALRERFATAGYGDALLGEAERIAPRQLDAVRLPLVHWWLERRRDPAALLARLFAYDAAVPAAAARDALGPLTDRLMAAEALTPAGGDTLIAAYRLVPIDDVWIWSDRLTDGADAVMGPGTTTLGLMRLMPPGAGDAGIARRVLDVGCGAGTLALWAARRGADATGTDLNPRAVALARFNARFNDVAVPFHAGDLAAPVAGRAFDVVVAQPPYVMQPSGGPKWTWLHGGAGGEDVTLRLLAELPGLLAPGGRALLFVDAPSAGEPPHTRYRRALADAALDLIAVAAPGGTADQHATAFAALESEELGDEYAHAVRRYRSHFEALGVNEFRRCAVVVRRAPAGAKPQGMTATIPARMLPPDVAALERLLRGLDAAGAPDAALLAARVRPAAGARWITERASPDEAAPATHRVSFGAASFAEDRELSDAALALLESLADGGDVGDALARYAQRCDASPEEVRAAGLTFVRQALATGLAEVAEAGINDTLRIA